MNRTSPLLSAALAAALVVVFGGGVAGVGVVDAAVFPLPAGATLAFEAESLDGASGNRVEVGGQILATLTQDATGFSTVEVPVPPAALRSGRLDAALLAGNVGAAQGEGYDDFLIRDPRLVLADGTVVSDERYEPGRAYAVGDGLSYSEDPTDVLSQTNPIHDYFGTRTGQTPEMLRRELRFRLPLTGRSAADAPQVPVPTTASGILEVRVEDPDGDAVAVEVMAADAGEITAASAGVGYAKPHEATPGSTTVELEPAELAALAASDGDVLRTGTEEGFPTQEFTLRVDPAAVQGLPHLEVVWEGRTSPGSGATLSVRDLAQGTWEEVASTPETGAAGVLSGAIDVASTVAEDGTILLQVQEERFTAGESDFTIAWMTDTQFYSERFPQIYDAMNEWIVANAEDENIIYTVHTGDITQNYNEFPWEWERASASMQILEDGGMPYGVVTGNHDIGSPLPGVPDHVFYDQFFPASRFEGWQTEHFRYGGHAGDNNRNHYDLVSYGGYDFLYLYLDWAATDADIAWANGVLEAHPAHHAVLNTHQYINPAGAYTRDGAKFFEQIVVPNDNVFMVLSGHHTGAAYNVRRIPLPDGGTRVAFEILHDYQGGPDGGSGYLRLLRFDLDDLQLDQQPYSPYTDDFDYGAEKNAGGIPEEHDDYTLSLDIGSVDRELVTDRIAVLVRTGDVVASADAVATGERVQLLLPADPPDALVVRLTDPGGGVAESRPYLTR